MINERELIENFRNEGWSTPKPGPRAKESFRDVSISITKVTNPWTFKKTPYVQIFFGPGIAEIISNTEHIVFKFFEDKLFFKSVEKGGWKICEKCSDEKGSDLLRQCRKIRFTAEKLPQSIKWTRLIGNYDLHYDERVDLYYINLLERDAND